MFECVNCLTYISEYHTKILEVNLFAFAYRLFHEDFSPINGVLHDTQTFFQLSEYISPSQRQKGLTGY